LREPSAKNNHATMSLSNPYNHHVLQSTFSSNFKYMLHASIYPYHLNFNAHVRIHVHIQDVHIVILISWCLLREQN